MTLDEARAKIGHKVVYRLPDGRLDEGVITSVNDTYVFVRYTARTTSAATYPQDLEPIS